MTVEAILNRFECVRRNGEGWTAKCPGPLHAHGDRRPSLSISEGRGGRTLLHCFTGCATTDIVAAVGLGVSDLYERPNPKRRAGQPEHVRKALEDLSKRLTARERATLTPIVIETTPQRLSEAIARALALSIEQEMVQVCLIPEEGHTPHEAT